MEARTLLIEAKIGVNYPQEKIIENILKASRRPLQWLEPGDYAQGRDLLIVGGAPSMKNYLEEIKEKHKAGAFIMALNGAYDFLVSQNIIPDCFVMLDARPINHQIIKNPQPETLFLIASQCHDKVFKRLNDYTVVLWHSLENDWWPEKEITAIANHHGRGPYSAIGGSQTVGSRALYVAETMGFKKLFLYGYDSSYADGSHHAYSQPQNDSEKTIELEIEGKKYLTTPLFARQVYQIQEQRNVLKTVGVEIIIRSDGFIKAAEEAIANIKAGLESDRDKEAFKYSQMWNIENYRTLAPGEHCVNEAIEMLGLIKEHKIIDFGAGTGRGAQKFKDLGFDILAVDIASNCFDPNINVPLCLACLWELPKDLSCDYGYCTDVMEHIPTDKVLLVIENIAKTTKKGCYFQICLTEDHFGMLIDDHLHLTVKPIEWWLEILAKSFKIINYRVDKNNLIVTTGNL